MLRLGLTCLLLCLTSAATGQTARRPALHWSRAEQASGCIDPRTLALRVSALTGSVLVEPTSADVSIEGHVAWSSADGFEVRIGSTTADGVQRGQRTLRHAGSDCRALDDAIAFVIALMIDPGLALEKLPASLLELGAEGRPADELLREELEDRPARPVAAAPQAPPSLNGAARRSETQSSPAPARAPGFEVQSALVVSSRELPRTALGAAVSAGIIFRDWLALELQLRVVGMLDSVQLDSVRSVSAQNLAGAALVCPRVRLLAALAGEGCLGPELFFVHARGEGFSESRASYVSGYAAHLAAGIKVELSHRWALRLRGYARLSPDTKRFVYTGLDGEHEALVSQRVAAGATLGVSYAF